MAITLSAAARNARGNATTTTLGTSPVFKFYTGSKPATPETTATGTLLATCACSATPAGATSSGVTTYNAITNDTSIDASGTVGWFRIQTSGGTGVIDGTVTATGGGGDITTPSTAWVATEPLAVTSFVITEGNA